MDEILKKITDIIVWYEAGEYKDLYKGHRVLVCNMYFLGQEQVKFHQEWNAAYYLCSEKSNAAKEREADKVVPELYLCRKTLEVAKGVSIAMGHELKMN
jgi:hypothetical protein